MFIRLFKNIKDRLKRVFQNKDNLGYGDISSTTPIISVNSVKLPVSIEDINQKKIKIIIKNYHLKALNTLEYNKLSPEQLQEKVEWHSWQVALMIKLYKIEGDLILHEKDKYFPDFLFELKKIELHRRVNMILIKFKEKVNIKASRDVLSKEIIWSGLEVIYLLYYIHFLTQERNHWLSLS